VKSRLIASVAVGVAVILGASGCSMISPQGTTITYSPADGINVPDRGAPLIIRNALVVANEDGTIGNLVAAVVNDTDSSHTLTVEVGADSGTTQTLAVQANTTVSLGNRGTDPLRIEGMNAKPGSVVRISFQSGDATPVAIDVPVLGGNDTMYESLVPSPTPTATPTPTPTASATP
jgi:hypothetical protein